LRTIFFPPLCLKQTVKVYASKKLSEPFTPLNNNHQRLSWPAFTLCLRKDHRQNLVARYCAYNAQCSIVRNCCGIFEVGHATSLLSLKFPANVICHLTRFWASSIQLPTSQPIFLNTHISWSSYLLLDFQRSSSQYL
jgi:hypothetical protein